MNSAFYEFIIYIFLSRTTTPRDSSWFRILSAACQFLAARAFSLSSIERILTAQAQPKTTRETLSKKAREQIDELLRQTPIEPRSTQEYQNLLEPGVKDDEEKDDN